jgi:membrane associated rhomboid family serine protease
VIPLRDENPSGSVPVITVGLILVNVLCFGYQVLLGDDLAPFLYQWGFVPARLSMARMGGEPLTGPAATLLSSMFLHGGVMHLAGNMWYLWLFGDNVEDRLGKVKYLLFYLAGGVAAALFHYLASAQSRVPTIGASGAIATVLGAYAVTYPRARVMTLIPFFPFVQIVALPALVVLGLWFVFQFFSGTLSLAWSGASGGVAWWAHIGGFLFGMTAMRFIDGRRRGRSGAQIV